jgi:hypothetical protein
MPDPVGPAHDRRHHLPEVSAESRQAVVAVEHSDDSRKIELTVPRRLRVQPRTAALPCGRLWDDPPQSRPIRYDRVAWVHWPTAHRSASGAISRVELAASGDAVRPCARRGGQSAVACAHAAAAVADNLPNQARVTRTGIVSPTSRRAARTGFQLAEVPQRADGRGSGRILLGRATGPTRDPHRPFSLRLAARRTAAVGERIARRNEPGRAAPRATLFRRVLSPFAPGLAGRVNARRAIIRPGRRTVQCGA